MDKTDLSSTLEALASKLNRDPGTPVANPTTSFWQDPVHPFAHHQSAQLPGEADIAVIGSGISAVSVAKHLRRRNADLKIVMLEARSAISGATGRNGGHIKTVPWTDYAILKAELGKESAMKITRFRLAHVDALLAEAEELGAAGKAGLARRVDGVCAVYDRDTWAWSKEQLRLWLEDFPDQADKWTVHETADELTELGLVNAVGCVRGPAGAAWPYRLVGAVLAQLMSSGPFSLETHTVVNAVVRKQDDGTYPYELQTSRGAIRAKHVIHCTNGYAAHLLPYLRGKLWPMRGQMTVQAMPKDFPRLGAQRSWSTMWAKGFDYITQSPGEDGSLYLGGGFGQGGLERDEDLGSTDDSTQSPHCLAHLQQVAAKCFAHGEGATIDKQWTGIMGFTADDLPMVDGVRSFMSGREECDVSRGQSGGGEWIAAGFNGYGMVHCWLAGKALAAMVTGNEAETQGWFPRDEFACTPARLDKMTPIGGLKHLLGLS